MGEKTFLNYNENSPGEVGFLLWNGEIWEEHKKENSKFSMLFFEVVSLSSGKMRILNKKMDLLSNSASSGRALSGSFLLCPFQLMFHPSTPKGRFVPQIQGFSSRDSPGCDVPLQR